MTKKLLTLLMFLMGVLHLQAAPVEPKVSTSSETHWYLLQFLNGEGVLEASTDGTNVQVGIPTGKASQLWKIEGSSNTGYTFISKNGLQLYTTSASTNGMFRAGTHPNNNKRFVWQTTTNTTYKDRGWVLSPKNNTNVYMNQWGGAGIGKEIGLWNDRADGNQPFQFVDADELSAVSPLPLIPYPASVTRNEGTLSLRSLVNIVAVDEPTSRYATEFAQQLQTVAGITLSVNNAAATTSAILMDTDASLAHEAYTLNITAEGIRITASDSTGFFYALQTLKQLMPHAIYGHQAAPDLDWSVPCVAIADQPQFGHRGYMLDVARHFFSKAEVKRVLDVMASYKMNRFHWHLTDDQGWRIEIPEYPKLTTVGSIRKGSFSNAGGSAHFFDDTEYGRGMFFTLDDLREIVAYAKDRNIEIMPEIDLPGHMVAAVAAYPELSCDPTKNYEVRIDGGISKDVLNVGKDEVIDFLKCVLGHVAEVFPFQYIHLGGDECPTDQWRNNPDCLKRVEQEGLSGVNQLQSWLVEKLGVYLKEKYNKDIVCWDELLAHWNSDNTVKPVIMAWNHINKSKEAADKGFKSIVVPYQSLYLDMMQVPLSRVDINEKYQGGWGDNWVNTVETVYGVNPAGALSGREDYCLGVQGNMWTETCNDSIELEYQLLPRLLALAETGWLPASKKSFVNFYQRLQLNRDILDAKGLTYALHYFEEPDYTEAETALNEAQAIIEASKPGQVGFPAQQEYDKLVSAYNALKGQVDDASLLTALTEEIAAYKQADIVLPQEGKTYQLVSASTYYKAKYVGSTIYCDGQNIRFHYTPQVEPEELWQFKAEGNAFRLTNVLKNQQLVLSKTNGTNATLAEQGTMLTIALATKASGKYTYVPGALTLGSSATALLTADCTGFVKTGNNGAVCYPGTWFIVEVTDFTAQLKGLVKKANHVLLTANPGKVNEPTEEALEFLAESLVTPAKAALAEGAVSEATYKQFFDIYAQFLAMPRLSAIDALKEDVYYKVRNAWFTNYYAKADASGNIVPATSGDGDGYLWQVKKNADGTIELINKLTAKAAYPSTVSDGAAIKTGTSYSWMVDEFTCAEDASKFGLRIIAKTGALGWYINPNAFQNVILKPIEWGAAIWKFDETTIAVPNSIKGAAIDQQKATKYYDLQGCRVNPTGHGVFITNTGRKMVK